MFVDGELEGDVVDDDCGDGDACLESWEKREKKRIRRGERGDGFLHCRRGSIVIILLLLV